MTDQAQTTTLDARIKQAISNLLSAEQNGEGSLLNMPIPYPSGALVVLEIVPNAGSYFVSDVGFGFQEAEAYGAQGFYSHSAKQAAQKFGVSFDGYSIFSQWVGDSGLESALVYVANASKNAAERAIERAIEEKSSQKTDELFDRVEKIFGPKMVRRKLEIPGRKASWDVHNVVVLPNRRHAIFESVADHPNSISSKFMMFSDLAGAENGDSLNAVVESLEGFSEKGQMLGSVANIIEASADDQQFVKLAEAA